MRCEARCVPSGVTVFRAGVLRLHLVVLQATVRLCVCVCVCVCELGSTGVGLSTHVDGEGTPL